MNYERLKKRRQKNAQKDAICITDCKVMQSKKRWKNLRRNNVEENKKMIDNLNIMVKIFSNENRKEEKEG